MGKYLKICGIWLCIAAMVFVPSKPAQAGIYEIIKAGITKVIKAVDLQIQRLQNKTIWLQNAQKELENTMSKLKLGEISEWTEKQREQYDIYFRELWRVKNAISNYKKIREIVRLQLDVADEYKHAWNLLQRDRNFNPKELDYMYGVYSGLLRESLKNVDQLMLVASSLRTQMSDGKRLEMINKIGDDMQIVLTDIRKFNDRNFKLSVSRTNDANDADRLRRLYGLD
ncbi:conjugal transfer protein TraI [Sphingobacterium phlebotomi]|uniref:Conjugal transfer protein TraI n=2 Tax=Sphingobacterium phlebotomi TaxID=2605433 RepID=A0A5D4HAJ8_9SPHI|nr:conjugal transfer protein TraI [Sphingobacterium phlebotomi]